MSWAVFATSRENCVYYNREVNQVINYGMWKRGTGINIRRILEWEFCIIYVKRDRGFIPCARFELRETCRWNVVSIKTDFSGEFEELHDFRFEWMPDRVQPERGTTLYRVSDSFIHCIVWVLSVSRHTTTNEFNVHAAAMPAWWYLAVNVIRLRRKWFFYWKSWVVLVYTLL